MVQNALDMISGVIRLSSLRVCYVNPDCAICGIRTAMQQGCLGHCADRETDTFEVVPDFVFQCNVMSLHENEVLCVEQDRLTWFASASMRAFASTVLISLRPCTSKKRKSE